MENKTAKPSTLHDLNNLLTMIGLNSRLLLMECPADDPRRKDLEELADVAERAVKLAAELKEQARSSPRQDQTVSRA